MPTTTKKAASTPKPIPALTLKDRCDATASQSEQAFVRFVHEKTRAIIDLCSHHANQHEASLIGRGFSAVEDRRDSVNSAPMPSSVVPEPEEDEEEED
jgi:hypothetical protein